MKNKNYTESNIINSDIDQGEYLQPHLVDFREFSHIAYELKHSKYSSWFESDFEQEARVKHAHQLSRQSLRFMQWENGSQENERMYPL